MRKYSFIFCIILALLLIFSSTTTVAAPPIEKIDVIIGFNRPPGPSEEGLIHSIGGNVKFTYRIIPGIAASIPTTAIQGLLKNPRVTIIEPDVEIHATDAELDNAWGVERIGAGMVHDSINKGDSVKVAIIDTGIDYYHLDLAANYAGGYDFVNIDEDPMDDNGHGTHVAGIVAALDNDSGVVGVAPEVELYALKVLDSDGNGSFFNVIAALDWATGNNPDGIICQITNNSYGSSDYPGDLVELAFDLAYTWPDWSQLHVAAAGNSGNLLGEGDNVEYPARFASVIAVASTDQSDMRAISSSTGPDVELAAPGVDINSTCAPWLDGSMHDKDGIVNDYAILSGTSMASPHVAGTAALVMAAHPTWTNEQVRFHLQDTAYDLYPAEFYGHGLVDAYAAVPPPDNLSPVAQDDAATTDEDVAVIIDVLANDSDPDLDPLDVTAVSDPAHGTAAINFDDTVTYTPDAGYNGPDAFTYTISDGQGGTDTANVSVTVNPQNDHPVAQDDAATTDEDAAVIIDVLANDSDPDLDPLDVTAVSDPAHGTAAINFDDTVTYTPDVDYNGPDAFTYTISDGQGGTDTANVSVTVNQTAPIMHIASITILLSQKGQNWQAKALVQIVDEADNPIKRARVIGDWSGAVSGIGATGTTHGKGEAKVNSEKIKAQSGQSFTFTFTVTDVSHPDYIYDPELNVETSDSGTIP
ncbi:S8 family serine peptidase [Chloroflexota bacterium]